MREPFHPGQDVALVDKATGEVHDIVTVQSVDGGTVTISPYTAHFAHDGGGLPLEEWRTVGGGAVYSLGGELLRPPGPGRRELVRRLPARHDIRPATEADMRSVRERDEADHLAGALEERFREMAEKGHRIPLDALRQMARLAGLDAPMKASGSGNS